MFENLGDRGAASSHFLRGDHFRGHIFTPSFPYSKPARFVNAPIVYARFGLVFQGNPQLVACIQPANRLPRLNQLQVLGAPAYGTFRTVAENVHRLQISFPKVLESRICVVAREQGSPFGSDGWQF